MPELEELRCEELVGLCLLGDLVVLSFRDCPHHLPVDGPAQVAEGGRAVLGVAWVFLGDASAAGVDAGDGAADAIVADGGRLWQRKVVIPVQGDGHDSVGDNTGMGEVYP